MAVVLFVVKASITPEQEEAFNSLDNEEHCPQLLQFRGAVSARRYKAIMGEDGTSTWRVRVRERGDLPTVPEVRASRGAEAGIRRALRRSWSAPARPMSRCGPEAGVDDARAA